MPLVRVVSDRKAREKPCLRCGYSLRKNLDARHCPECGLSVWLSLNGNDSVDLSNPLWLGKLRAAAAIMAGAQLIGLAAWAATELSFLRTPARLAILALLWGTYALAYHAGMLLLSIDEHRHPDKLSGYRWSARIISAAGALIGAAMIYRALAPQRLAPGLWLGFWNVGAKVVLLASALATWAYLRMLARRIPSSKLAWICACLLLVPFISLFKFFPIFTFILMMDFVWVLDYLPWAYFPASAALLALFAVHFHRAGRSAEANWVAETAV